MAPPSAISSALTELVPRSRPRSIGESYPCPWDERFSFIRAHHAPCPSRVHSPVQIKAWAPKAGPLSFESAVISPPFSAPLSDYTTPTAHKRRACVSAECCHSRRSCTGGYGSYRRFIAPYPPLSVAYDLTSLSTAL